MTITKEVTFIAKENDIEKMKELLITMVEPSKAEEGCLFYHICQLKENPKKFIVLESWKDEKALDFHKSTAHYKHYKSNFEPYCAEKSFDEVEVL